MGTEAFTIEGILKQAWGIMSEKYFVLLKFALVIFGLYILLGIVEMLFEDMGFLTFLVTLISFVFQLMISLGGIRVALKIVRGEEPEIKELLVTDKRMILTYLGASILMALLVLGGFMLLVIPGVIVMVALSQTAMLIVDKGLGVMDSFRESMRLTKGVRVKIFIFQFVLVFINILGLFMLGLGLLVTIPLTVVASYLLYEALLKHKGESALDQENLGSGKTAKVAAAS